MSLAEILTRDIRIQPGSDGSFVAWVGSTPKHLAQEVFGFTNAVDLVAWLQRAADARQPVNVLDVAEPLVTRTVTSQVKAWPVHEGTDRINIGDPVTTDRVRRTTAAGDLADRVASTGDWPAA